MAKKANYKVAVLLTQMDCPLFLALRGRVAGAVVPQGGGALIIVELHPGYQVQKSIISVAGSRL